MGGCESEGVSEDLEEREGCLPAALPAMTWLSWSSFRAFAAYAEDGLVIARSRIP